MKATGIVRRIDDLGRIAIPKEIRRSLKIREGTPMEIFLDDGGIVLKKYEVYEDLWDVLNNAVKDIEDDNPNSAAAVLIRQALKILREDAEG